MGESRCPGPQTASLPGHADPPSQPPPGAWERVLPAEPVVPPWSSPAPRAPWPSLSRRCLCPRGVRPLFAQPRRPAGPARSGRLWVPAPAEGPPHRMPGEECGARLRDPRGSRRGRGRPAVPPQPRPCWATVPPGLGGSLCPHGAGPSQSWALEPWRVSCRGCRSPSEPVVGVKGQATTRRGGMHTPTGWAGRAQLARWAAACRVARGGGLPGPQARSLESPSSEHPPPCLCWHRPLQEPGAGPAGPVPPVLGAAEAHGRTLRSDRSCPQGTAEATFSQLAPGPEPGCWETPGRGWFSALSRGGEGVEATAGCRGALGAAGGRASPARLHGPCRPHCPCQPGRAACHCSPASPRPACRRTPP